MGPHPIDIVEIVVSSAGVEIGRTGSNRWYIHEDTRGEAWIWRQISHFMEGWEHGNTGPDRAGTVYARDAVRGPKCGHDPCPECAFGYGICCKHCP